MARETDKAGTNAREGSICTMRCHFEPWLVSGYGSAAFPRCKRREPLGVKIDVSEVGMTVPRL